MISVLDLAQTLFGMFLIRRVAKNLQLRTVKEIWGCGDEAPICHRLGGLGAKPPAVGGTALEIFVFFWEKYLNFRPILIEINAIETWHRN